MSAWAMASLSASRVRSAAFLTRCFIFEKASSMRLRSGEEYAGRNTSSQPLTSMSSLTLFVLCAPRARQAPPPLLRRGSVPEPSLHVSLEELFVGSPLYAHALAHPSFQSDGGDQGLVLASVSRNPAIRPLAPGRPRPQPIHRDRKATLVDEHQSPCVKTGGQPLP